MKKIIILEHEPLSDRLYRIWMLDEFKKRNISYEYWDLSVLCNHPLSKSALSINDEGVVKLNTIELFLSHLNRVNINETVFIVEIFQRWSNYKIFKILSRKKCFCIKIDLYANTTIPEPFRDKFKKLFYNWNLFTSLYARSFVIYSRIVNIKPIRDIFSSSQISNRSIDINHPDYEEFNGDYEDIGITEEFALFIDEYYPLHPDLPYCYNLYDIDVEHYRKLMQSFFLFVEKKYKLKIVVAAHPKAGYKGNEFGDRLIMKGKTCALVKASKFIIMHESNSLSFIALADKPFAMVYPDSYKTSPKLYNYFLSLAKYYRKPTYNLDRDDWNFVKFDKLDSEFRKMYIYSFLTSNKSSNKKNIDIVLNYIENCR